MITDFEYYVGLLRKEKKYGDMLDTARSVGRKHNAIGIAILGLAGAAIALGALKRMQEDNIYAR